jgi:hypothetical protein
MESAKYVIVKVRGMVSDSYRVPNQLRAFMLAVPLKKVSVGHTFAIWPPDGGSLEIFAEPTLPPDGGQTKEPL